MKYFISVFTLLITVSSFSQDFANSKNTLLQFQYLSESSTLNQLDKYSASTSKEKAMQKRSVDKMSVAIEDLFYESFERNLVEKNITIEDKNVLENFGIIYNNGYPNVMVAKSAIKKVTKKGYEGDLFFNVNMDTNIDTGLMSSSSKIVNKFIPSATFKIDIWNSDLEKVKELKFKASAPEKIENKAYFGGRFDKMDGEMIDRLIELLSPLIAESVDKAFEDL